MEGIWNREERSREGERERQGKIEIVRNFLFSIQSKDMGVRETKENISHRVSYLHFFHYCETSEDSEMHPVHTCTVWQGATRQAPHKHTQCRV